SLGMAFGFGKRVRAAPSLDINFSRRRVGVSGAGDTRRRCRPSRPWQMRPLAVEHGADRRRFARRRGRAASGAVLLATARLLGSLPQLGYLGSETRPYYPAEDVGLTLEEVAGRSFGARSARRLVVS